MSTWTRGVRISRDKVTGVLVALACLAFSAIGLKVNDTPDFSYVDGQRNQPVVIERAELTVGDVQIGTRLIDDGEVEGETTGMFVSVRTTLAVPGNQRVNLNRAQLVTATRTYDSWSGRSLSADAGFQTTRDLVFEVDPAQIDDLSLVIWSGGTVRASFSQRARVHLGITPANAAEWRQAAVDRNLEPEPYESMEALP